MPGQYVATYVDVTDMENNMIDRVFHEWEWVEDQLTEEDRVAIEADLYRDILDEEEE